MRDSLGGTTMLTRTAVMILFGVCVARPGYAQASLDTLPTIRTRLAELMGCYAFSLHETPLRVYGKYYNASWLVRLDTTPRPWPSSRGRVPRVLTPLDQSPQLSQANKTRPNLIGPSWWTDSLVDTLRISFSDGLSGTGLTFVIPRSTPVDALTGFIANYRDYGPPFFTDSAFVKAVRKRCAGS